MSVKSGIFHDSRGKAILFFENPETNLPYDALKLEIFEKNSNFTKGICSHLTRKAGFTKGFLSGMI